MEVAGDEPLEAVGLAAAGFVDVTRTRVLFAPHLPWHGEDVVAGLSGRWGVPVIMDNDANCTALAEAAYGAARGSSSTVLVTLGTGIGGAVMFGDQLWRGAGGMAGEFGHQQMVPDGLPCQCGRTGCWEQYCSGQRARPPRARAARGLGGADPGHGRRPRRGHRADGHRGRRRRRRGRAGGLPLRGRLARASGWPTWSPPSTPPCSWSAVASPPPAGCSSTRPGRPSPARWSAPTTGWCRRWYPPRSGRRRGWSARPCWRAGSPSSPGLVTGASAPSSDQPTGATGELHRRRGLSGRGASGTPGSRSRRGSRR